jgi:hypothetical protein
MIYLAGPVDGIGADEANTWRDAVSSAFPNVLFFHPQLAYRNANMHNAHLMTHMNKHAIRCSNGVLVNLTGEGRGFGSIREIEFAREQGKRVVVACRPDDIGEHTLLAYDLELVADPIDGMQKLLEWLTDRVNSPQPTMFGFPFGIIQQPEEDEE